MAWELKHGRYMTREEVLKLRRSTQELAERDLAKGRDTWVRYWAVMDLASQTGLRVSELVALRIGHLKMQSKTPYVMVYGGKGRKATEGEPVRMSRDLVKHMKQFIAWKKIRSENANSDAPLFASSQRRAFGVSTLQYAFKRACKKAGINSGYSIHALRHSWGTYLYAKTHNLRLVQKELRHRNVQTTTVYADVTPEEACEAVNGVWGDDENGRS